MDGLGRPPLPEIFRTYGVLAHPVFYCLYQYVKILMGENLQDFDLESTIVLLGTIGR